MRVSCRRHADPAVRPCVHLLVQDDRRAGRNCVENDLCHIGRKVYTAVRAVGLVDLTAELLSPARVVQALSVKERHPVHDRCSIGLIGRDQCGGTLLVGDREDAGLGLSLLRDAVLHRNLI